jgi:hypothetical protein
MWSWVLVCPRHPPPAVYVPLLDTRRRRRAVTSCGLRAPSCICVLPCVISTCTNLLTCCNGELSASRGAPTGSSVIDQCRSAVNSRSGPSQAPSSAVLLRSLPPPPSCYFDSPLVFTPPSLSSRAVAHDSTAPMMARSRCSCHRPLQLPVAIISAHHPFPPTPSGLRHPARHHQPGAAAAGCRMRLSRRVLPLLPPHTSIR